MEQTEDNHEDNDDYDDVHQSSFMLLQE